MSHSFLESANESNFLRHESHDLTLVLSPAAPGVADVVAASFSSYASDGAWRDFVGATVATVGTDDEWQTAYGGLPSSEFDLVYLLPAASRETE